MTKSAQASLAMLSKPPSLLVSLVMPLCGVPKVDTVKFRGGDDC